MDARLGRLLTRSCAAVAVLLVAGRLPSWGAIEYTVIELKALTGPGISFPERPADFGLSANGDVAGLNHASRPYYFKYPAGPVVNLGDLTGDFGTGGNSYSWAYGVNSSGWVTGGARNSLDELQPFIWRDDNGNGMSDPGEMRELAMNPGATAGAAYDINDAGQVIISGNGVCRWTDLNGDLVVDANERVMLTTSGSYYASGVLNEAGDVLYSDSGPHRWIDANGDSIVDASEVAIVPADIFGGLSSTGSAMNNHGDVAGFYQEPVFRKDRGFLWCDTNADNQVDASELTDLGSPQLTNMFVWGVNDDRVVVGAVAAIGVPRIAVSWDPVNGYRNLNTLIDPALGIELEQAWEINNAGQIVVHGNYTGETTEYVFLLTPRVRPDLNHDGMVDGTDFDLFAACAMGSSVGPIAPTCGETDFDTDNDVDAADFGLFQRCVGEPGKPARPGCDD